jgi:hypothetical protein
MASPGIATARQHLDEHGTGFVLPDDCLPEIRTLYDYWDGKRRGRIMPSRADLDPVDIPLLLQYVFLIDVARDPLALRYRVFGTALAALFRRDLTGLEIGAGSQPEHLPGILARYARILAERVPFFHRDRMREQANDFTTVERLIVPLSRDGVHVDQLIGMTVPYGKARRSQRRLP